MREKERKENKRLKEEERKEENEGKTIALCLT